MRFHSPEYILFLLLPILVSFLWRFLERKRVRNINELFSEENIENLNLINSSRVFKNWLCRFMLIFSYVCFCLALARPQFGQKQKSMVVSEQSVVFLIDLSRSMLTKDIAPSRLEMVKREIFNTLKLVAEVRVGLVVFAGSVDVISPMTSDLEAVESYVESLSVDSVSSQGTEIRSGLEESKMLFERSFGKGGGDESKVVVLFSDGETHEDQSIDYAKKMAKLGYKIFAVGVGTESGGFVPEEEGGSAYIRNESGQAVVSKPNFDFLKELASVGDGAFYYLSPLDPLGPKIQKRLNKIEGVAASRKKFIVRNEVYQIFLVMGVLFMVLGFAVRRF